MKRPIFSPFKFTRFLLTQSIRLAGALVIILCVIMLTSPAQANPNTSTIAAINIARPDTEIATIKFNVGRLEQDLNNYGQWTEYDFRGNERYRFTEISSDKNFLRLQGEKGNVQLLIDFEGKTIAGEWAGHPMEKLYTIVSVEKMMFAQTLPSTPINEPTIMTPKETITVKPSPPTPFVEVPTPLVTQPAIPTIPSTESPVMAGPAPLISPPFTDLFTGKRVKYDPVKVTLAKFKGGSYIKKRNLDWIETDRTNTTFDLRKIGHSKTSIFLFDNARNLMIELDLKKKVARMSTGERLLKRHSLTEITEEDSPKPSKPEIVPQNPSVETEVQIGRLSVKERFECRKDGGFVERAGRLGYERCTSRYSDGGNVCLDSRDCQGKCMTTTEAGQKNVAGKCQMTDNPFGCRAEVINGEAEFMLCVD